VTDTTQQILAPGQNSLPELATAIKEAHVAVMRAWASGAAAAIAAGKALAKAKELIKNEHGHGYWQDYVTLECGLGLRTSQVYMYLAKHEDQLRQLLAGKANGNASISQTQALKLLSAGRTKRRPKRKKKPTE
jgi:hypothetical protein